MGAVKLRAIAVAREQTLDIANLERHLHQREGEEQVKVLKLGEPLLGLPSVETQQRHRGVDVLVECVVVAVNVMRNLVVVPPHQTGPADQIIRHAERVVHPHLGRHRAVVAAVLDRQPDPRPARPSTDPATIPGMLKYSVYANAAKPRMVAAARSPPVRCIALPS